MVRSDVKKVDIRSTAEVRRIGGYLVRSNLKQLVLEKQAREGRKIYGREIARATDIQEATISRWMSGDPMATIHSDVLGRLMKWGGWSASDLLTIEQAQPEPIEDLA